MDVLIVGSGGREHALAWKLAQSPRIGKLYVAPGNGGTRTIGENVPIAADDIPTLVNFARERSIGLTVVGPENPLALGIVDAFHNAGLKIFGPTKSVAQVESSKAFSKQLMREAGIPTAGFQVFTKYEDALAYVRKQGAPIVVKASGLALGKGVYVCNTIEEAESALKEIMIDHAHKDAGAEVVVEEFLDGEEISIHILSDGKDFLMFPASQDHKRIGEGDTGRNSAGMGTIAPVLDMNNPVMEEIQKAVIRPALDALASRGVPFSGLLYPGLKMTSKGPKVLEFNARFGDPETQVYMRLMKTDLLDVLEASTDGRLAGTNIEWNSGFAVNIVLASGGYPDAYKKGCPITGTDEAEKVPGVVVFHAGTVFDGELKTSGGRVLGVSAVGDTLKGALEKAYTACDLINFEGKYFRRDIGARASL
ncbi:MAG TPA: phosphoribosylamine--glycine ligase [Candidatus Paceibacterota bacterium]|nr:phosphoribosylamine--glycine ligase [Candidatus Paceibacterota bacterium]